MLYDANGYLLLPDGREYPNQETQDEIMEYWRQQEAEEQKWWQENRGLPRNIKDFYKYFRPKVDELMARHGFEYAPQLFNPEAYGRKKMEPDLIIYAKPMTNGQQTIYINYRDIYNDGEYSSLGVGWYLSDETVERIYLHELGNITSIYGKTNKKQLIRGGVVNMEYYLSKTWYRGGPSCDYKTETEIEALLAHWDQKLQEVAWIDTYDDIDRFYELNTLTGEQYREINKDHSLLKFTYDNFALRTVIVYLSGRADAKQLVESWLAADDKWFYTPESRERNLKRISKALEYMEAYRLGK